MIQAQRDANGKEQKSEQKISSSAIQKVSNAAVRTDHVDPRGLATTSALHSIERQATTVLRQQGEIIGTTASVVTSNQRTTSGTILAQSVPQISMPQRIVLNSGMSDVFLRLSPSTGPSNEIIKEHSYSLLSAISALSSTGNTGEILRHLQDTELLHKDILTGPAHTQVRTGTKRLASVASSRSDSLPSVNNFSDIGYSLAFVNKMLSGVISLSDQNIPSIPGSQTQKKMKLGNTLITKDVSKRKRILDHFTNKLFLLKCKYYHQQAEYFFLKSGGNIMEFTSWKKNLPTELLNYLTSNTFDRSDDVKVIKDCLSRSSGTLNTASCPLKKKTDVNEKDEDDVEVLYSSYEDDLYNFSDLVDPIMLTVYEEAWFSSPSVQFHGLNDEPLNYFEKI